MEESNKRKNKLAVIGFSLMLAGPAILISAFLLQNLAGNFPKIIADIIMWITLVLPGIGAVLCIISLVLWKRTGNIGRSLSIVTVVMCNPVFYFVYLIICGIAGNTLAGLSWM